MGDTVVDDISDGFLRATEIPLLEGRMFDDRDRADSQQVTIVNQALVKEYFLNENPIGREIKVVEDSPTPWMTIVGVVGDLRRTVVYKEMGYIVPPTIYRPLAQDLPGSVGIMVRSWGDPAKMRPALERAVSDLDKDVPLSDIRTANERIAEFFGQPRFRTAVLGGFAALALLLAAIGLYGLMSQSASQRKHEIGIRMALGAERGHVLRMVLRQGMGLTAAGIGIGLTGALALTRLLIGMLYGVKPADPLTLLAVALILSVVAGLASYIPARGATKVDPMVALRHE